jgi:hypothetical protein
VAGFRRRFPQPVAQTHSQRPLLETGDGIPHLLGGRFPQPVSPRPVLRPVGETGPHPSSEPNLWTTSEADFPERR